MMDRYGIKPAKIVSNVEVAKDTYMLEVEPILHTYDDLYPFNFFMIWIPRIDEIPLSIADFDGKRLKFLYKIKGTGTKTLAQCHKDMIIGVRGPFGKGIKIKPALNSRWLIIAGGIGVAPIPYLIRMWASYNVDIDLIWGTKTIDETFNIATFFPIVEKSRLIIATEDCNYKNGYCGTVVDVLEHINVRNYDSIIAVGPNNMLRAICLRLYYMDPYIALETIVKCGIGICGSCYIKSSDKLLCIDGPVFKCSEVINHLQSNSINS